MILHHSIALVKAYPFPEGTGYAILPLHNHFAYGGR